MMFLEMRGITHQRHRVVIDIPKRQSENVGKRETWM